MVKVLIHTDTRYPVNRKIIRKAILDTFSKQQIGRLDTEISVAVVGKRKMDDLSKKFLDDENEHEVLAFALEEVTQKNKRGFVSLPDGILRLGDVVLCWPYVVDLAAKDNIMVDEELAYLVGHGAEHLIGKHHE